MIAIGLNAFVDRSIFLYATIRFSDISSAGDSLFLAPATIPTPISVVGFTSLNREKIKQIADSCAESARSRKRRHREKRRLPAVPEALGIRDINASHGLR
jgi:hypothetical protein